MSGKVPVEDMTEERVKLLQRAADMIGNESKSHMLELIAQLSYQARVCPRTSCAYCEHIARSEAHHQQQVGEAEAG